MPNKRVIGLAVAALAVGACGSAGPLDSAVTVKGTDKTCVASRAEIPAGKSRFSITNKGKLTTELYVLGKNDRIVSEVENVLPGSTASLEVSLRAGKYTLQCKPGQSGDGIRTSLRVTGSGGTVGEKAARPDHSVDVNAQEYAFVFAPPTIATGQAVQVRLHNRGKENHEFEVLDPAGNAIGEIAEIAPGADASDVFSFATAGTYEYQCLVEAADGATHKSKGMRGTFTVS